MEKIRLNAIQKIVGLEMS